MRRGSFGSLFLCPLSLGKEFQDSKDLDPPRI
jgi:hypothetical protein